MTKPPTAQPKPAAAQPKPPRATGKAPPGDPAERAFLDAYDPAAFERLSVAVDVALLSASAGALHTLVVRRGEHPAKGRWALPGTFVGAAEPLEAAAARALSAKGGLSGPYLEQLFTFGDPARDPRTRVLSVAYYALVDFERFLGASRASREVAVGRLVVPWEGETGGPVELVAEDGAALPLAFDHADILGTAVRRLRGKLDYTPVGFQLLPASFTLLELQRVHETVLDRPLNKDSFRRRMLASGLLEATGERQADVDHRPAERYRFARRSAV
jgi:ADP-ribose pyrophosphatase YjhB (NUDIX family)